MQFLSSASHQHNYHPFNISYYNQKILLTHSKLRMNADNLTIFLFDCVLSFLQIQNCFWNCLEIYLVQYLIPSSIEFSIWMMMIFDEVPPT